MHWVIQENLWNEKGFNDLIAALLKHGCSFSVHKVIPFLPGELDPVLDPNLDTMNMIAFGSTTMTSWARKMWSPGAYISRRLSFSRQVKEWHDNMLNYDAQVDEIGNIEWIVDLNFIRPDDDGKAFAGELMYAETYEKWREEVLDIASKDPDAQVNASTKIVVADPKMIHREYRVWMVGGKAVTASQYKYNGRVLTCDRVHPSVTKFAEYLDSVWSPELAYCLDVAETDMGLKVIEVNCINSSGFYAANVDKIVEALEEISKLR